MRTRNQTRREKEEDEKASSDILQEARCENQIQPISCKKSGKKKVKRCLSLIDSQKTRIMPKESKQGEVLPELNTTETRVEGQDTVPNIGCACPTTEKDTSELDWEDGTISNSYHDDIQPNFCGTSMTVEFNESPPLARQRTIRRASTEDKMLAELVHKVHLLCLLARGRLIDRACSDPLIQASVLSLLPPGLLNIMEVQTLTISNLAPLVNWFHSNFHVQSSCMKEGDFKLNLSFVLETREGTTEEVFFHLLCWLMQLACNMGVSLLQVVALSVALFRALNLSARFVSILDVASLKPDADLPGFSNQDVPRLDTKIPSFSPLKTMVSPGHGSTLSPVHFSSQKSNCMGIGLESAQGGLYETKFCNMACNNNQLNGSPVTTRLNNDIMESSNDKACGDNLDASIIDHPKKLKRKGDIEFELQLEMALSATTVGLHGSSSSTEMNEIDGSSDRTCPPKKLKKIERRESTVSPHGNMGAVWSRKAGPPLCWAEVYFSGEALSGRWVHVDAANGIIDSEQQIESAFAACRRLLKYVVAFAGSGAKDVTRRYCMQWHKIASQRINSSWWDVVLAPLKQLESAATGGVVFSEVYREDASADSCKKPTELFSTGDKFSDKSSQLHAESPKLTGGLQKEMAEEDVSKIYLNLPLECCGASTRESLEDMELETRALTEPLPTNQLAYRNHHLYAIERWLTMYQVLYPKGPVLGYCSGHPVYPRACVQMLQTKQKWLRGGMQVKVNEAPAKVVKHSQKGKGHISEPNAFEENDGKLMIELYGKWQVEPLCLPPAVDGVVPKNERGQVEVWSEKCLPPGTVHLRLPRLVPVAKRLEVDFAPAMVGFEFRNGRSYPIFEGIVVCTEFKDAILEAYAEEEERREAEEKKRSEAQALSRWYQLLCSIITRQRLKNTYEADPHCPLKEGVHDSSSAPNISEAVTVSDMQQISLDAAKHDSLPDGNHEHIFPAEYQSFDEESSVRIKRCPCGFSIQMEQL